MRRSIRDKTLKEFLNDHPRLLIPTREIQDDGDDGHDTYKRKFSKCWRDASSSGGLNPQVPRKYNMKSTIYVQIIGNR